MLRPTVALLAACVFAQAAISTGPDPGKPVPPFTAKDQDGNPQTLQSLTGSKGLVLVFFRSADW